MLAATVLTRWTWRALACVSALLLAVTLTGRANACGGLFCSSSNPVNQVAERIIFALNDDATITAVIEIQYEGPAHEFAWVLPVPAGDIDVGVSSTQALDALQSASNPVYNLNTVFADCGDLSEAAPASDESEASHWGRDVTVLNSGAVGPYEYAVIEVNAALDDRADAAVEWLGKNGYDITGIGPETLRVYLDQDMNLLAFRLQKNASAGSIRPAKITYPGTRPVIPIRPTAVAAQEDMGILVWVLGAGRAVPGNYLDLELNDARINWFNPGPSYDDVVSAAADEAGGWGFVTEQSGPAGQFAENVYPQAKSDEFDALRHSEVPVASFLNAVVRYGLVSPFSGVYADGFLDVMKNRELLPVRDGTVIRTFLDCVNCYFDGVNMTSEDPIAALDRDALLDALAEQVHRPLAETRALFRRHATVTRLYTTLSPDEMTIDPEFVINQELPEVSNVHLADQRIYCDDTWAVTTPQGFALAGSGAQWPLDSADMATPFNARLLQHSAQGDPEVVMDNGEAIKTRIDELGLTPQPKSDQSGFCAVRSSRGFDLAPLLCSSLALGLFGWRRRGRAASTATQGFAVWRGAVCSMRARAWGEIRRRGTRSSCRVDPCGAPEL